MVFQQIIIFDYDRYPTEQEIQWQKTKLGFGRCICYSNGHCFDGWEHRRYDLSAMWDFIGYRIEPRIRQAEYFRLWLLSKMPYTLYTDLDAYFIGTPVLTDEPEQMKKHTPDCAMWSGKCIDINQLTSIHKEGLRLVPKFRKRGLKFIEHKGQCYI